MNFPEYYITIFQQIIEKTYDNSSDGAIPEIYKKGTNLECIIFRDENKKYHRDGDRPAIFYQDGYRWYFTHGKQNRLTGPALIRHDGSVEYWVNGEEISEEKFHKI